MPTHFATSGLNPATRPRWPKLTEGPQGITVVGTHRCFARRKALYYGARAIIAALIVFTAVATAGALTANNLADAHTAHLLDRVSTFHAHALQWAVHRFVHWPNEPEEMKYAYFLAPVALAVALAICLPLLDPLVLPVVRKTTRLLITPHEVVVSGWGPARGRYPLGDPSTLYLHKQPYPHLDRIKSKVAERVTKLQRTEPSLVDRQWVRWHDEMRDLVLVCGQRQVRLARFVNERTCDDFLRVCQAGIDHARGS